MPGRTNGVVAERVEIGDFFYGSALSVVDAKGRTSLPASFRAVAEARAVAAYKPGAQLPDKAVLIGEHPRGGCLQGYDHSYQPLMFARLQARAEAAGGDLMEALDDLGLDNFGTAEKVGYDPTGRMVLPAQLREVAGIETVVLFIAAGETFQIWNPDRFREAHADKPRLIRTLDALEKNRR